MDVKEALEKRRAYRALGPAPIDKALMDELAGAARLMPSCFNNQPWKFVFVKAPEALARVHACLAKGNDWPKTAPLIIAAFARKDYDCVIKEREYYLFDLGLAVAAITLRAAELGLVAHPIAGFDNEAVRAGLGIPEGNMVLTLVIVGKKTDDLSALSKFQADQETGPRPARLALENIYAVDKYDEALAAKPQR